VIRVEAKQKHIGELAKHDPSHSFKRLYRVLCDEAWLTEAWKRIRQNKGSKTAGVDGTTKDDVDEILIRRLTEKLRKEEYQPTPVKRVYIPKANGKKRPLGIPTIQDRIVQSALKMLLEPIYEQEFRNCSQGFRPKRSCITALGNVAIRFPRSTWVIEGDITGCYDNIHHGRLLSLLRKRVRDEKLLGLIYSFLKAGYLERWICHRTYSGTPQGGIVSPLLANIYLHELDKFMEDTLKANPKGESKKEMNARVTKESKRTSGRISRLRSWLKMGKKWNNWYKRNEGKSISKEEREQIVKELKTLEKARKRIPSLKTRTTMGYTRYADDYLITLQQHSKAEAEEVKEKIGIFLKTHLHLEQSLEKTLITHPTDKAKFLGFDLRSRGGRSKGLYLAIPKEAVEELLKEVDKLCKLHHIDEADLILKVNEKVRGWMNYYRYASAPQRTFSDLLSKVFWLVSHYLAAKHKTTMPTIMRTYARPVTKNGRTRTTIRKWVKGKAIDLWTFPPETGSIRNAGRGHSEIDGKARTVHEWATGRSAERRMEALEEANYQCQECGTTEDLQVHHKGGLQGYQGTKNRAMAGKAKGTKVLCRNCHLKVGHQGSFAPKNRGKNAA
jgi:group II intron reverse transcriptase/maturase